MNIYYNGIYIFNVDMIEPVNQAKLSGFNGFIIHKGNRQIMVNLMHHIAFKKFSDEIVDDFIFKFSLEFEEKIECMAKNNNNEILILNSYIVEFIEKYIEKYLGENNGK